MNDIERLVLIVLVGLYVLSLIGAIFYFWKGWNRWFYHDIMEWHRPKDVVGFDGCSFTTRCRYCNKRILQDSQGNWFSIGE